MPDLTSLDTSIAKPWLVTGGAGYIGAHVIQELAEAGIPSVLLDIDSASTNQKFPNLERFSNCDIRDKASLREVFAGHLFEGVIHLVALKSVEESQKMRKEYFETNVVGTKNVLDLMLEFKVSKLIFSSSAAVYEAKLGVKLVDEASPLKPVSFYGQTKVDAENIILELSRKEHISAIIFRYFNVAGAATSELQDKSTQNLIPITINKLKSGLSPEIFGDDYDTPDGTAVRDYVDVRDIARAHLKAIDYLSQNSDSHILNIGTGHGASVKEVVTLTQEILGTEISTLIKERRSGDISAIAADCKKAEQVIGFRSHFHLREMIETSI